MAKRTPYQDKIIRRYYQNQDQILLQRLGDMVAGTQLIKPIGSGNFATIWLSRRPETGQLLALPSQRAKPGRADVQTFRAHVEAYVLHAPCAFLRA